LPLTLLDDRDELSMRILRRVMLRLVATSIAAIMAAIPLTAGASSMPSVDSLWNTPQGPSMDSALYVIQSWWDGYYRQVSNDPTQRGLDELSQANADLLNAYTLLQHEHSSAPQPVAILDPLLSSVYNAITQSNAKAPLGSLFSAINHGLLSLEGRDSTGELVRALLQDYRANQAVAVRDLHATAGSRYDGLLAGNAQREADFLTQVTQVSAPDDGVASLLADADLQTTILAGHRSLDELASAGSANHGKGSDNGHGQGGGQGQGNVKSQGNAPGGAKKK
jgi:hypothetical protein